MISIASLFLLNLLLYGPFCFYRTLDFPLSSSDIVWLFFPRPCNFAERAAAAPTCSTVGRLWSSRLWVVEWMESCPIWVVRINLLRLLWRQGVSQRGLGCLLAHATLGRSVASFSSEFLYFTHGRELHARRWQTLSSVFDCIIFFPGHCSYCWCTNMIFLEGLARIFMCFLL